MEMVIQLEQIGGRIVKALQDSKEVPEVGMLSFGMWMHSNVSEEDIVYLQTLSDDLANDWLYAVLISSRFYTYDRELKRLVRMR